MIKRLGILALAAGITGCSAFASGGGGSSSSFTSTPSTNTLSIVPTAPNTAGAFNIGRLDDVLVSELADFRISQGLPIMARDAQLDQAAQVLADVMARRQVLDHGADGQRAGDRIDQAGYVICTRGKTWSENIARSTVFGSTDSLAKVLQTGWENSSGHRKNMVGSFAEVGIAVALSRDGSVAYAVQVFASPGPGACA